jgi:N-acylglucosamine-6-phosphate 2-epimerase
MKDETIKKLHHGLIVSCQAEQNSPFNSPEGVTMFAESAVAGGAIGIRSEGVEKTRMIIQKVKVPVVGLIKSKFEDGSVKITGRFSDVEELIKIHCQIIAVDGTFRKREGLSGPEFIRRVKSLFDVIIMADIAKEDEAIECEHAGADLISTTLNGYTPDTITDKQYSPNFDLIANLSKKIKKPLIAEGRVNTPEAAKKIIEIGAYAVVVGTAITRPHVITNWFVDEMKSLAKN